MSLRRVEEGSGGGGRGIDELVVIFSILDVVPSHDLKEGRREGGKEGRTVSFEVELGMERALEGEEEERERLTLTSRRLESCLYCSEEKERARVSP